MGALRPSSPSRAQRSAARLAASSPPSALTLQARGVRCLRILPRPPPSRAATLVIVGNAIRRGRTRGKAAASRDLREDRCFALSYRNRSRWHFLRISARSSSPAPTARTTTVIDVRSVSSCAPTAKPVWLAFYRAAFPKGFAEPARAIPDRRGAWIGRKARIRSASTGARVGERSPFVVRRRRVRRRLLAQRSRGFLDYVGARGERARDVAIPDQRRAPVTSTSIRTFGIVRGRAEGSFAR